MRVLVLLSTYNGESFLAEQLDSLFAQENVELHILVRDDGSKDSTSQILDDYNKRYGRMTIIKGRNIGAGPSFFSLINEAASNFLGFDYYAFSDQDDVWFPQKIYTGVRALEKCQNTLKLCYSRATNTDAELKPISSSCIKNINSFGANLVANHILGCTMLFNEQLLCKINRINVLPFSIPYGKTPYHDSWTAIVAYSLNADVVFINKSLMYYRQHGRNVVGGGSGFFSIWKNRIRRNLMGRTYYPKSNRCILALQLFSNDLPDDKYHLLWLVTNYRHSIKAKYQLMTDKRMYEYGLLDNIGVLFLLLFNRF